MGSSTNLLGFWVLILLVFSVNWCESISCFCNEHERNVLLSFQKTHLPNSLESWSGDDCCTWEGIECSKPTCHVVSLNLRGVTSDEILPTLNVNDILTSTLTQLRNLEYLDLSSNQLSRRSDDTPKEFNRKVMMNQLQYLDLSSTNLDGQIPHQLGNLSNLQVLDLSHMNLYDHTGFKWVLGLQKLRSLNISNVDLSLLPTNSILELLRLSTLQELQLSDCQLGQHHFLQFLSNSTILSTSSLKLLSLGYNYFNSTIPSVLGSMRSLQHLDLTFNTFSNVEGGILGFIEGLCGMKYLDLSNNNLLEYITFLPLNFSRCSKYDLEYLNLEENLIFSGGLEWLGRFSALKIINLHSNMFSGNLESIIKLSFLNSLYLSNNRFSGTIPTALGKLSFLTYLNLAQNNFNGTIPSTLGRLSSLGYLDISKNNFNGILPSTLGQLSSLTYLYLSNNNFTGTIPSALGQLSSLTTLFLSNNNFTGTIPSALGQLSSLTTLDLSNNNFTGTIPSTLVLLSSLELLDMSNNKLTGVFPHYIHRFWPSLTLLNLAYNNLNGTIPMSLCYSQALSVVDMKSNRFSGQIPDCSSHNITVGWKVVDLSSNSMSGCVPNFLWELPQILLLNLSNNTLKEELPMTISQSLEILDLGENDFYGKIPSWHLSGADSLKILRLRSNRLVGMVPFQMCLFDNLQIIDLANNLLTGPIPKCFGNLSGMRSADEYDMPGFSIDNEFLSSMEAINGIEQVYTENLQFLVNLDLSRNNFSGSIPVQLTELQGLKGLNVSHNQLTGKIPSQIGRMKSMVSLDLSNNNLQGSIPQGLADLTSLSSLNLSYNKLHGPIPTGSQLLTFTDPSIYAGNANLCGDMLPKKCSTGNEKKSTRIALDEDHNRNDPYVKLWFPGFLVLGTIIGFWGVIGIINMKQGWKYAYLRLGDEITDWIYVRCMVKKLK